jgi:hypothetical protein
MSIRSATLFSILCVVTILIGCSRTATPPARVPGSEAEAPPLNGAFMGHLWISTTPGASLGSFMLFLANRTLLMGSCVEPYRLSKWGVAGSRIRWIEDQIPIEADIALPRMGQMTLQITGQDRQQTYVQASAPRVCPDLPR